MGFMARRKELRQLDRSLANFAVKEVEERFERRDEEERFHELFMATPYIPLPGFPEDGTEEEQAAWRESNRDEIQAWNDSDVNRKWDMVLKEHQRRRAWEQEYQDMRAKGSLPSPIRHRVEMERREQFWQEVKAQGWA